jgi:V-type H+-transporting ATPase subunit a
MSLGIICKGLNSLYFRQTLDFCFEFIPQILLLLGLFGWMDALIIGKWLTPMYVDTNIAYNSTQYNQTHLAPPIITTMIDMFLAFGDNKNIDGGEKYKYVFNGQAGISIILLLVAFISVPTMLMVKPLILKRRLAHHNHGAAEHHSLNET